MQARRPPPSMTMGLILSFLWSTNARSAEAPATAGTLLPAIAPVLTCSELKTADLAGVADRRVQIDEAKEVTRAEEHPYCLVKGMVEPKVHFEVHLPLSGWTQRYLQTGCGGLCGDLHVDLDEHVAGCTIAAHGELALASSDMGHEGGSTDWAANNPQARADFGYRGMHVTALAAKALIERFYGEPPRYSYFSGCSDGGREALIEAQRYPADFNGISAGAPALNFTVQNSFYHAWNTVTNIGADGKPILTAAKLPMLHAAVLAACDAADGVRDGLISDPLRCRFDPGVLLCRQGQNRAQCLSAAELGVVRRIYNGATDSAGRKLVIGGPMPGSELAWAGVIVPDSKERQAFGGMIAADSVRNLYYDAPLPRTWTVRDLKFDEATLDSFKFRAIYDATNPDLSSFRKAGGRLIMWHGWSDPHISPLNSIAYYTLVQRRLGADVTSAFARLFLLPGMYHCGGGDGLFNFDVLTPLMAWVERGDPPDRLIASHDLNVQSMGRPAAHSKPGVVDRTRPVFAYPHAAHYVGRGSIDDPENFVAADPPEADKSIEWLGAKYMVAGPAP